MVMITYVVRISRESTFLHCDNYKRVGSDRHEVRLCRFPRFSVLNNVCILDISDRNPIPIRKDDDVTDPEHTLTEDMFKGFKIRP